MARLPFYILDVFAEQKSACYSGTRDESLHSLAESLSQSSNTCVGTSGRGLAGR